MGRGRKRGKEREERREEGRERRRRRVQREGRGGGLSCYYKDKKTPLQNGNLLYLLLILCTIIQSQKILLAFGLNHGVAG